MKVFALFAAFSVGISVMSLRESVHELAQRPLIFGSGALDDPLRSSAEPRRFGAADEGLLDSELASDDPIQEWLVRYLTPARD